VYSIITQQITTYYRQREVHIERGIIIKILAVGRLEENHFKQSFMTKKYDALKSP
jgi:hypothetical protein